MRLIKTIFYFFIIFLSSCNTLNQEEKKLYELLDSLDIQIKNETNYVIQVSPITGCSNCNTSVSSFMHKVSSKQCVSIFSCYSIKDFHNSELNVDLADRSFRIDSLGLAMQNGLAIFNTKLFFIEKKRLIKAEQLDCSTSSLINESREFLKKNE